MLDVTSTFWAVSAVVAGVATGRPLGRVAKERVIAGGWSEQGRDSVGIACYVGAVYGISCGIANASHDFVPAILHALCGGFLLGFALAFRYLFDGIWDDTTAGEEPRESRDSDMSQSASEEPANHHGNDAGDDSQP